GMRVDPAPLDAIEALPDSGYVRVQAGEVVLIADVGAIGPDYLPGHAHADTLSFELSLDGRRVLVNSGTSLYEAGAERLRQRGTAAHNTVIVDGTDSSEVWSSFRVARRARPLAVRCGREGDALWLEAAHDGYRRLRPAALHRRRWTLTSAALEVDDQVDSGAGRAVARFHFHPDVARGLGDDGGQALTWAVSAGVAHLAPATWHPHFGASVPTRVLVAPMQENSLVTRFRWS
ncbi:MAG: hypothetical protein RL684_2840, partial [Pseudomonadota bacterium]